LRTSIRSRLIVTLIGLAVVPLLVVGIILAWQGFSTQQNQVLAVQDQIALRASIQITDLLKGTANELQLAVRIQDFKGLKQDKQKLVLSELLVDQNALDKIYLLDNQGQEVVGVARDKTIMASDLVSRAQNDEFVAPMADRQVYYSPVHIAPDTGQPLITVAVPIVDLQSDTVENVLVADLRFKSVQDLVANIEIPSQGLIYVVDSQNQVVVHKDPSITLRGVHFVPPIANGIYNGLSGGSSVIATQTIRLGKQTFVVIAETPVSVALALALNTVEITAILIAVALVIAIIIGLFVVRRLVKPIQSLAVSAQAIQHGDFSKQTQVVGVDELGQLAQAFNDMVVAIQKRETDLRQQADELRVATAKATEASRVKGEFLANVSHELRTPLNAIIGFSDMLLMGMSGELNDKQRHKIERLEENGKRLLTLINHVLDLTRIEARRIEIASKPFSPTTLAERLTAQMQVLAERRNLNFITYIDPALPKTLVGDEDRIEQVIVNLLSNAFKFTEKGTVTLEVSLNLPQHEWNIVVSDTGMGIPPHALEIIFEEFRQVDGSSSRAFKGSGLGLAITRNLVRIMDGQIQVQSELEVGSKFIVSFPINEELEQTPPTLEKA